MHRRAFFAGLGAVLTAPAIVHVGNLMPVRSLDQALPVLHGDGIRDDTNALQALFDGKPYVRAGKVIRNGLRHVPFGQFKVTKSISINAADCRLEDSIIESSVVDEPVLWFGPSASASAVSRSLFVAPNCINAAIYISAPLKPSVIPNRVTSCCFVSSREQAGIALPLVPDVNRGALGFK